MRRFLPIIILWTLLLASCSEPAPAPATKSESAPAANPTTVPSAEEIRFALVGQPKEVNVWSLFDESGASYANYALRADTYPSLYRLSIPSRTFEPYLADGMPSVVTQEGSFYIAMVKLKPGLKWNDGSPLTAYDVAFTVNAALSYHLSLDWNSAYDPNILDHAQATDNFTVKFLFKAPFTVANWQYGALQGPVVSRNFWASKLIDSERLLPGPDLTAPLTQTQADANRLQADINEWNSQLLKLSPASKDYSDLSLRISKNQDQLNSLWTRIDKLSGEYNADLSAARNSLFALRDDDEPTFGPFLRATVDDQIYTRRADSSYPFDQPHVDRAVYQIFPDEAAAVKAWQAGRVNVILVQHGLSSASGIASLTTNADSSARFLAFNPRRVELTDPILHRALECMIDRQALADMALQKNAIPLSTFVLPGNPSWLNVNVHSTCTNMNASERLQKAVDMLRTAGYRWKREPTTQQAGEGLILPGGVTFPPITLLTPKKEIEPLRAAAADYIVKQAQWLGLPLSEHLTDAESIRYAVYSSGDYDLALLGWRLSEYPAYLCAWFQPPSPFVYNGDKFKSACETLNSTADLVTAQSAALDAQSALMSDLPFIPLYEDVIRDAQSGFDYPFQNILDGISGVYGAPALAVRAP